MRRHPVEQRTDELGLLIDVTNVAEALEVLEDAEALELCSADTDFARFTEVRWSNPLAD